MFTSRELAVNFIVDIQPILVISSRNCFRIKWINTGCTAQLATYNIHTCLYRIKYHNKPLLIYV